MTEQVTKETCFVKIAMPSWFKGVAIIALIWNLFGVLAFMGQMMITPEMLAELPVAQQELYTSTPEWAKAAFAIAVFSGVVVQMFHAFFLSKSIEVLGISSVIMPVMVTLLAIYLVWLSKKAQVNGWLS